MRKDIMLGEKRLSIYLCSGLILAAQSMRRSKERIHTNIKNEKEVFSASIQYGPCIS